jgi:outer membrane protein assembly factor BamB
VKQSDKFEVLATNQLDESIDATPALVGKQLFLRGEKFLYCIEEP